MKRKYSLFIKDIIDSIEKIDEFTIDLEYDEFIDDDKTCSAVIRKLEVIGEAAKNIPNEIIEESSDLPWREMARMRDKLIHSYFGVDYEIVWKVVKNNLPQIKPFLKKLLSVQLSRESSNK